MVKKRRRAGRGRVPLTGEQSALAVSAWPIARHHAREFTDRFGIRSHDFLNPAIDGLFRAARDYDPDRHPKFSTVAWNLCRMNCLLSLQPNRRIDALDHAVAIPADLAAPTQQPRWLAVDAVADLIRLAPLRDRALLEARYRDGLTQPEAADRLGIPQSLASKRERVALAMIRERLEACSS